MKQKNIYFYTNLLAWGLVFLLAGNYVFGWTTPTSDPPDGDLSAPLDMSSTEQTKTGNLIIDSLLKVGRYSSAPTGATGALYYDTTENAFKGYKSAAWADLGGTAPVSSVFSRTGAIVATTGDYTVSQITGAAPLASPTFTGTVTAPTFSGALSGNATSATTASDVSCTNCLTATEVASADYATTAGNGIPSGMIAMFNTTCPTGWTRFAALDNRTPRGATIYGGTGGENTHTHTVNRTCTTKCVHVNPSDWCRNIGACISGNMTSGSASSWPPYLGVIWCQKD